MASALVRDKPVEFEKSQVEVQDLRNIALHFSRGIYGIYLNLIKKNPKDVNMSPVGLGTLGY